MTHLIVHDSPQQNPHSIPAWVTYVGLITMLHAIAGGLLAILALLWYHGDVALLRELLYPTNLPLWVLVLSTAQGMATCAEPLAFSRDLRRLLRIGGITTGYALGVYLLM